MRVLVTGATGFIGRALCMRLLGAGHVVVALSRSPKRARVSLGAEVEIVPLDPDRGGGFAAALDGCDGVVHLAGESISGGRWTDAKKARIRSSRVDLTRTLVAAMTAMSAPPRVLVSGSAVGVYGDRGDEVLTEQSAAGDGFLADVAQGWEAAALEARAAGVRVALVRTGVVLGVDGGALPVMALPFRMGVGGRVGDGRQYVPWIHRDDMVEVLLRLLEDDAIEGPVLATAPTAATNATLSNAIGAALGRPAAVPAPAFAMRLGLGEAAALVLDSTRCRPQRLLDLGFRFRFGDIEAATRDLLQPRGADIRRVQAGDVPDHPYLKRNPPTYRLAADLQVAAPLDAVFSFFGAPANLGALSPADVSLTMQADGAGETAVGQRLGLGLKLGPVPLRWEAEIIRFEPGRGFTDVQRGGPYRGWWHEHDFEPTEAGTRVLDRVLYAPPLGPVGEAAQALFIEDQLQAVFDYRRRALRWRFGGVEAGPA